VLTIEVGAAGASDQLMIGGLIDLTASTDSLALTERSGGFDGSNYTIATFDENSGGGIFNSVTGLPSNYTVLYTPTSIMLVAIPEPCAPVLLVLGVLAVMPGRRTRALSGIVGE
jgi:hypothetical protein